MTAIIVVAISYLSHLFDGSLGWAIFSLSLSIRAALFPLTLHLARQAQVNQALAKKIQPEIAALKTRHGNDRARLYQEIAGVHAKHNFKPLNLKTLLGSFAQLPIFGAIYKAIKATLQPGNRFLWIKSLAAPDFYVTVIVLALTLTAGLWMPLASESGRTLMICMQVGITLLIIWKLAAGLSLYWVASALINLIQTLCLRRRPVLANA